MAKTMFFSSEQPTSPANVFDLSCDYLFQEQLIEAAGKLTKVVVLLPLSILSLHLSPSLPSLPYSPRNYIVLCLPPPQALSSPAVTAAPTQPPSAFSGAQAQFALLEFEKPVICAANSLVIGARLDIDAYIRSCVGWGRGVWCV